MIDHQKCSGCGACFNICPKGAITMQQESRGFLVPVIDEDKCVHCNLCEKTCPAISQPKFSSDGQHFYAAWHKDLEIRRTSSSGGLFTAISDLVLKHGGAVVGVKQTEDLRAEMGIAFTREQRDAFKKSKYVQCETGTCFQEIKRLLDSGTQVLFTGVPCQVGALKLFLRREYSNLICVDILCHGVPSEAVFKEYIAHKEKKAGKKIAAYQFRDRHSTLGWKKTVFSAVYEDGTTEKVDARMDNYFGLFYRNIAHRDSCFSCAYKTKERTGDITLGDFWGVEKHFPQIDTFNGVSLMICNSEKGAKIIEALQEHVELLDADLTNDLPQTMRVQNIPYPFRNAFFRMKERFGFSAACFVHVFLYRLAMKCHLVKKNYQ